jgi:hypothetical protein
MQTLASIGIALYTFGYLAFCTYVVVYVAGVGPGPASRHLAICQQSQICCVVGHRRSLEGVNRARLRFNKHVFVLKGCTDCRHVHGLLVSICDRKRATASLVAVLNTRSLRPPAAHCAHPNSALLARRPTLSRSPSCSSDTDGCMVRMNNLLYAPLF